jgi:hypothetical protein
MHAAIYANAGSFHPVGNGYAHALTSSTSSSISSSSSSSSASESSNARAVYNHEPVILTYISAKQQILLDQMKSRGYHETIAYRALQCTSFSSVADAESLYKMRPNDLAADPTKFQKSVTSIKTTWTNESKQRRAAGSNGARSAALTAPD